jgi:hypothetical protein
MFDLQCGVVVVVVVDDDDDDDHDDDDDVVYIKVGWIFVKTVMSVQFPRNVGPNDKLLAYQ